MKKWIRKFDPQVGVFPRRPEFPGAGEKILVRAIHRNRIAFTGDAHGRLETTVTGDRIVGQDAAIASSADPELAGVGDSLRHDVIDTGQQVLDFQMTPVGEYRLRVIKSAAAAASIIDAEDDIAFGGEHLPLELPLIETEIVLVLPARAAVYPQKSRVCFAWLVVRWLDHQPVDFRAVPAVEFQLLDGSKFNSCHQRIVVPGDFAKTC